MTRDAELLEDFAKGNPEALSALVDTHGRMLYGYILSMTHNRPEADDIFQETWFRVMRRAARFREGNFKGWIMRIAHNIMIDRFRRNRPNLSLEAADSEGNSLGDRLSDPRDGPTRDAENRDLARLVRRQVSRLPAEQREVFLMRTDADMPFREIAETLGIPLNTALGRMRYALIHLRRALGPLLEDSDSRPGLENTP